MCSVSAALIGLTAAQGVSQIAATRQQTKAQEAYYNNQAEVANQNARVADRQREQLADKYAKEQEQLNAKKRLTLGQHAAEAGASGLSNSGSVQDMDASTIDAWKESSMDLLSNQRNDTKSAYINQVNYINQANAAKTAAYNAKIQGRQAMFGTILSTAASIYGAAKNYGGSGSNGGSGTTIGSSGVDMYGGKASLSTKAWTQNKSYNWGSVKGWGR